MVTRAQVGTVKRNPRFNLHTSHISPLPKSPSIALSDPNWRAAMYDEYNALQSTAYDYILVVSNTTGATSFLYTEYQYVECANPHSQLLSFSTISVFLLGAITSIVSGFLGMKIATYANARTALEARKGLYYVKLELDVGADLVGKVERNIPEDDPRNPAVIADNHDFTAMCYPLLVSSVGILVCLITTLFATDFYEIKVVDEIQTALKKQLYLPLFSKTVVLPIVIFIAANIFSTIFNFGVQKVRVHFAPFIGIDAWKGTNFGPIPVQDVADSCRTGAATNVIFGLALGYKSVSSNIAIASCELFDNAGGIAEMAGMSHRIRERTDALDAAGNTTAAIGKGFAIGSAALVSLALFGAFVSRAGIQTVDVLTPKVFIGLIVGAMLPYWFSTMTMKSVGSAALKMTLSGVLAGALVSGVQVAISASNTGGAWDNAKKYIEAGASEHARTLGPKGSEPHKAAVIGDTIETHLRTPRAHDGITQGSVALRDGNFDDDVDEEVDLEGSERHLDDTTERRCSTGVGADEAGLLCLRLFLFRLGGIPSESRDNNIVLDRPVYQLGPVALMTQAHALSSFETLYELPSCLEEDLDTTSLGGDLRSGWRPRSERTFVEPYDEDKYGLDAYSLSRQEDDAEYERLLHQDILIWGSNLSPVRESRYKSAKTSSCPSSQGCTPHLAPGGVALAPKLVRGREVAGSKRHASQQVSKSQDCPLQKP
ncbi:pyrophosphate-energized vacuolar membrane proton pump 1 [Tanacetum coccineum]|uniref:H(+)-exporting diphosphatase n=1 Tax=Tanacetum coccineum TaxID=301880 RepID=A0ABQ4WD15_9ASTR